MLVDEIFGPTIQGEGQIIGMPTVFVRTGGCDYHCEWCDTLHAVLPEFKHNWRKMTPAEVFAEIEKLSGGVPLVVTLSGGNPALHNDIEELIELGHELGYKFSMETQGSRFKEWMSKLDYLVLSPKPPSSGMDTDWAVLDKCAHANENTSIKVVIFDSVDMNWFAEHVFKQYNGIVPLFVQVGNLDAGMEFVQDGQYVAPEADEGALLGSLLWLAEEVIKRRMYTVRVLPQLHVLLWGNKRGV